MPQHSAGIIAYRRTAAGPEVLLVHPGGPFWTRKDAGAWSIPKGLWEPGEEPEPAARREFSEETGFEAAGPLTWLGDFRLPSGKIVTAFALAGDFDPAALHSNSFSLEWPPHSGRQAEFPEVDRAGWFAPAAAREKLPKGQLAILDALLNHLA
jgi:predicted NUDIX family NTP pyrophosphohydrolase